LGAWLMKWYKHLVGSGDDPDIDSAVILFGSDGYYVFFRTLEIMAREFDVENPGQNVFLWEFLRKKYRISARKLVKILSFFHQKNRILFRKFKNENTEMVELNCPKLKALCDEYTQKKIAKMSGQYRDNYRENVGLRQQITDTDNMLLTGSDPGFLNVGGVFLPEIIKKCRKIHDLQKNERGDKKINIAAWVNQAVKHGAHPKAVDYSLDHLISRWETVVIPWPYIQAIFQLQNGNFWEKEHIKESEDFKNEWAMVDDKIKDLIEKINGGGGQEK
jgi:hypothetical protein